MNNFVKQAYVQGLAARAILRARIMQKRAGIGDYALAGGVGAGGGAIIGALVNAARKKNLLHGALAGAGIGGVAGLGYQGVKDLLKKDYGPQPNPKGRTTNPKLPLREYEGESEEDKRTQNFLFGGGMESMLRRMGVPTPEASKQRAVEEKAKQDSYIALAKAQHDVNKALQDGGRVPSEQGYEDWKSMSPENTALGKKLDDAGLNPVDLGNNTYPF